MRCDLPQVPGSEIAGRRICPLTTFGTTNSMVWTVLFVLGTGSCSQFDPPGTESSSKRVTSAQASAAPTNSSLGPVVSASAVPAPSAAPQVSTTPTEAPPHPGPWLTLLSPSAAIYSAPNVEHSTKLGYVQSGARLAVTGKPKPGDKCNSGWLEVVGGGYICSAAGSLDEKDSRAKFTIRRPELQSILPYTYARNAKNGTPLYRTVPTQAQMLEYEPYLKKETEKKESDAEKVKPVDGASSGASVATDTRNDKDRGPSKEGSTVASTNNSNGAATVEGAPPITPDAGVAPGNEASEDKPWWQRDGIEDKLHQLHLNDLKEGSDGVLALRMVKGFYIAVDKTFRWNGRTWYKSTKGLVAPADRMGQATPSDFHGVELGTDYQLPIGWVYGGREKAQVYEFDTEKKRVKPVGTVARFVALKLTAETQEVGGVTYRAMGDGKWVRQSYLRITEPGAPPAELREGERWVDVDLSTQTLVVFEGQTPIFATLISSGKSSKTKEKDHGTPTGQWRIREKHITATMDGDGTDAGDNPYSIEDVPFVMYFHKSYAVHGAFWHRNYGAQMSHGCVNLAPLDAKAVFMKTEPSVPTEWHGAWSSETKPGSWVVIHD